jgi:hypothetical protein
MYNKEVRASDELVAGVRILLKETGIPEKEKRDEFARLIGRYGHRMCSEGIGEMYKNTIIKIVRALRDTNIEDFRALIRGDEKLLFGDVERVPGSFGIGSRKTFEAILSHLRSEIDPEDYGAKSIAEQVILEIKGEIEKIAKKTLRDRGIEDPEGSLLTEILNKIAEESRRKP